VLPTVPEQDHAKYQELLGAYALGALPEEERVALERHLAACPTCQQELRPLIVAARVLPLSVEERSPSPALRERIRSAALPERGPAGQPAAPPAPRPSRIAWLSERRSLVPWAAAAVFLLFSVAMLAWNLQLRQQIESIALQPAAAPQAHGQVIYLRDWNVVLITVEDLPPLQPGQVYQVWLIEGDRPRSAGVFEQPDGRFAVAADISDYSAIAITIEQGPLGSPAPTSDPVVIAPLGHRSGAT